MSSLYLTKSVTTYTKTLKYTKHLILQPGMTTFWPVIQGWISIYTKTWSRLGDSKESDRPAWPRKSSCWPQKAVACLFWSEEKNVRCQWSTKHDLAVVQQNGREGEKMISLYIYMFVFVVSWQFVYNALCTFYGVLFPYINAYR